MVLLSRIYTRSGDKGKTSLGSGERVLKSHKRIEVIGLVDEINAAIGVLSIHLDDQKKELMRHIQHDLFDVGADLCMPDQKNEVVLRLSKKQVAFLENEIDALNEHLAPLTSFVLPGGSEAAAHCHWVRTVVRRAERALCQLHEAESVNNFIVQYINRLSDFFFVLARVCNKNGKNDILWKPGANQLEK